MGGVVIWLADQRLNAARFFEKSHLFMPVYDPIQDTFTRYASPLGTSTIPRSLSRSLRRRSPISLTAILLAAKLAEDGGSELRHRQSKQVGSSGGAELMTSTCCR